MALIYGMGLWTNARYVVWSLVMVRMILIDSYIYIKNKTRIIKSNSGQVV